MILLKLNQPDDAGTSEKTLNVAKAYKKLHYI